MAKTATTSVPPGPPANQPGKSRSGRSLWADARRRLARDRSAMICLAIIGLYLLIGLGGVAYDLLSETWHVYPRFTQMTDYDHSYEAPSLRSWRACLGTDWAGRSVLIKTLLGAKVALTVGLMANVIAVPLGLMLGAVAGFFGRWIDDIIVWLYSTLSAIPGLILLIALKYAFKGVTLFEGTAVEVDLSGIHGLYIALGITSWIGTCRLVRAEVLKLRELDYVLAARASGRGGFSILVRHLVPNVLHIGIINFSLGFVGAVVAEVMLSYLGLGVAVGTPSWGTMINSARLELTAGRWWELTSAVTAMFFLVLGLNIFGDRLRDAFDPRLRTA